MVKNIKMSPAKFLELKSVNTEALTRAQIFVVSTKLSPALERKTAHYKKKVSPEWSIKKIEWHHFRVCYGGLEDREDLYL